MKCHHQLTELLGQRSGDFETPLPHLLLMTLKLVRTGVQWTCPGLWVQGPPGAGSGKGYCVRRCSEETGKSVGVSPGLRRRGCLKLGQFHFQTFWKAHPAAGSRPSKATF